eukprot:Transcript_6791.p5 GENE.Transcript_6791~~Transcript_6791.p5  ORF type:complete len:83 (-),score=32.31 Transcript_6791:249-497(-)
MGDLAALEMLWLDNNPLLNGSIPASLVRLGGRLTAVELSNSAFGGVLPALPWSRIPDCTLNGLTFDCPLPPGAATSCGARCR